MRTGIVLFIFLILSSFAIGQDHFLVELEEFTPPEKELIASIKGFPAEMFLANDIDGEEHFLGNYKGTTVILWFWSTEDQLSSDWLSSMNLLHLQYLDDLKVFGFAHQNKEEILPVTQDNAILFSNIPNGTLFGDAVYGGDLGLGRMFFIDEFGIVKEVLPRSFFEQNSLEQATPIIEKIIEKLAY